MLIKIITIHDIGNNFGSTLQACALCDYVKNTGYNDVVLINYKPDYAFHNGKIGDLVKRILFYSDYKTQRESFKKYLLQHCNLTEEYNSYDSLSKENEGDVFIVGSDQLWNERWNAGRDEAYYLGFTACTKKMSYAASLGQMHTQDEMQRLYRRIKDFAFISIRERASLQQLYDVGLNSAVHVLDPVFLHEKEYYLSDSFENKYGNYVFVYSINNDTLMDTVVKRIASEYNFKIVLVGGYLQKCPHDYYLRDTGPIEFVNLIANAKYVVANSFHATAFSIIFNKQFVLIQPNNSPLRLKDLLDVAETGNRFIQVEKDIDKIGIEIDYSHVNAVLETEKKRSKEYINSVLDFFNRGVSTNE